MSALAVSELTVAAAARIMREAGDEPLKDRSYITTTGLGREVAGFFVYFKTDRGKTEETCRSYEYCLAAFALYYADLRLEDFDGKHGSNLIRDFLRAQYADVQAGTWNTRVATLKAFFKWAFEEGRIEYNPAAILRTRNVPDSDRKAHSVSKIGRIVSAQDQRRDRIALQLLGRMALRRNELRVVQFKHVNTDTRELTVFGKGGTVKRVAIMPDLFEQILRERVERQANPEEFLLYPAKLGKVGRYPDDRMGVIWEDRLSPLSLSGIDKWWVRMLKTAGVARFPMHELRHSALTNYWRETRDLRLTQKLARHKKISTTADIYLHDDVADLAESFESLPAWTVE